MLARNKHPHVSCRLLGTNESMQASVVLCSISASLLLATLLGLSLAAPVLSTPFCGFFLCSFAEISLRPFLLEFCLSRLLPTTWFSCSCKYILVAQQLKSHWENVGLVSVNRSAVVLRFSGSLCVLALTKRDSLNRKPFQG